MTSHHETKTMWCPVCEDKLEMATNAVQGETRAPEPGDVSVCLNCASPLQFVSDTHTKLMSREEVYALPFADRHQLLAVVWAVKYVNSHREEDNRATT